MREQMKKNLNVPNALTLLRLLLIPVYWWLMMVRADERTALLVFACASATDLLDGFIARRFNLITDLGKLFDPLADKLMVMSVMLSLVLKKILPWPILAIIIVKELIMMTGGALMYRRKVVVYAKPIGKIAQFVIVIGLILCFFRDNFAACPLHLAVLWAGVALTLAALAYYTVSCVRAVRGKNDRGLPAKEE